MIVKKCLVCGREFICRGKLRMKTGKYCSYGCMSIAYKENIPWNKGKKGLQTSWNKGLRFMAGENNPAWKGGKSKRNGYYIIFKPNHPFASARNYILEHRLIAEKCLGRYLKLEEIIHHINGIKDDNRSDNLYLFPSEPEHASYEGLKNKPILQSNII